MYELFGCNDNGSKQVFDNNRGYNRSCANGAAPKFASESCSTLPPGLQWPLQPLASQQPLAREHDCEHFSSSWHLPLLCKIRGCGQEAQLGLLGFCSETCTALAYERQTGYCRTPNSKDHPQHPYHMVPYERLVRCQHCLLFFENIPNWKYYDDASSTECCESDDSEDIRSPEHETGSAASSATVEESPAAAQTQSALKAQKARKQKYLINLIHELRMTGPPATTSAPEEEQFKEHNIRIKACVDLLHATLDDAVPRENPGQLDEITTESIAANTAIEVIRDLSAMD